MSIHRRLLMLGAAVLMVSAGWTRPAVAQSELPIGLIMPTKTILGKQTVQAAEIAVEMINASGGALGRKVRLVVYDDNYSGPEGAAAAQRLLDQDRTKFMGGNFSSTVALAIIPVVRAENALYIASIPKSVDVSKSGYEAAFMLNTTAVEDRAGLERVFAKVKPSTVAYIGENTDFGRQFADTVRQLTVQSGGKVVFSDFYDTKQSDFNSVVTLAKASKADTLITMGGVVEQYANVVRTARDMGYQPRNVIIGPGAMNQNVIKLAGAAAEGAWSVDIYLPSFDNALNRKFVAAYEAKYKVKPEKTEALSFETIWLIASAINKAGTTDVAKVARTLRENAWETPRGQVRFTPEGRVDTSPVVVRIKDKQIVTE